jgi:hypothetical protein
MSVTGLRGAVDETRALLRALSEPAREGAAGAVGVSGMLAEQLARELGRGAAPGAVFVADPSRAPVATVAVHVIAGDPSEEDATFVTLADRTGVPVVVVQLWPQTDWTAPFVLSPFVVECRPGEGFPMDEIASRIVEAADAPGLGARIPALRETLLRRAVLSSVARAALLGASGRRSDRPRITLEQARLLGRVQAATGSGPGTGPQPTAAALAALYAAGFALRAAARATRRVLPAPVGDVAVAAAGTWALGKALGRLEDVVRRRPRR